MADKRISQLIERTDIANNDVLPIVASGATTTNKVTISTIQDWMQENLDVGVTSVGLSMPSAFTVSNSPVTTSGNISVSGAGTTAQYIRGDGSLADFPSSTGGGSSVSYYLNGSVNQGTIGGIAYRELSKSPILGAGTDFTINADGYIASFITDAGDPNLLLIPAGNWNFETYLQASSGGGSPTFYIELYKVSGSTATLIASNSGSPELIAFGTNINPYFSALAVPETSLLLTDRLAIRYYVTHSGRTITLHTENNTLCQIITTFTTGLTALNGLTAQVQNFATGTGGTDFNISSASTTHTFNIPTASATNRGALSSADWITFNAKQPAGNYVTLDTAQTITAQKTFTTSGGTDSVIITTTGAGFALDAIKAGNGEVIRVNKTSGTGNAMSVIGGVLSTEGISVNTPANGIGLILNGTTSNNFSSIRFGANTGGGQYNSIQCNPASFDINSLGNTPISFGTNVSGGGGTRMIIAGSGGVTFTNGITTTSAVLTSVLQGVNANFSGLIETTDSVRIGTTASVKHSNTGFTLSGFNNIHGNIDGFVVQNQTKGFRINFPSNSGFTHTLPDASGTIALTSNLGAYLPLAGGTLTGALNGTSAVFSGALTTSGDLFISGASKSIVFNSATNFFTQIYETSGSLVLQTGNNPRLTLASTGAATFSSSVTATRFNLASGSFSYSSFWGPIITGGSGSYANFALLDAATNGIMWNPTGTLNMSFGGNVGIGTASPSSILDVVGSGGIRINEDGAGTKVISIRSNFAGVDPAINVSTNNALLLQTNNTERMRITSGGFLKASNTGSYYDSIGSYHEIRSNQSNLDLLLKSNSSASPYGELIFFTAASPNNTTNYFVRYTDSTANRFLVYSNGNVVNTNGSYGSISDAKLKENITDASPKLEDLLKVKVRNYNLIGEETKQIGVIAQELEEVFPSMIDESEDFEEVEVPQLDEEGNEVLNEEGEVVTTKERVSKGTTTKSVKYSVFVPMLIKAIQEQQEQINSLKNQIQTK